MRRAALTTTGLVTAAALLTACGGGPHSPGVASLGSTSPTTTTAAGGTPAASSSATNVSSYADDLAYAICMRAHGEPDFPDPSSEGMFVDVPDRNTTQFSSANHTCRHLLPNGGEPTNAELRQLSENGLKYATCMRSHGVARFPDPTVGTTPAGSEGINFSDKGLDLTSSVYRKAQKTCRSLLYGSGG